LAEDEKNTKALMLCFAVNSTLFPPQKVAYITGKICGDEKKDTFLG